ncbi:hypothetical protein L211DRAFT_870687 [Terfezia boudieri ATCC MYA-4762]|uniref:Uncharacterized protein n=1 Tax=Terfezia boudieri ATCC MYA-4762 TaxID=1051890 RepID=A0A3N4LQY5_9PEZI|nr:hypothetical protein L211DRAFT_870687 [Terfezia boudieri ATCC MYA-4762]
MPGKGKRKDNPVKMDRVNPPLKTRIPVTDHLEPQHSTPNSKALRPPSPPPQLPSPQPPPPQDGYESDTSDTTSVAVTDPTSALAGEFLPLIIDTHKRRKIEDNNYDGASDGKAIWCLHEAMKFINIDLTVLEIPLFKGAIGSFNNMLDARGSQLLHSSTLPSSGGPNSRMAVVGRNAPGEGDISQGTIIPPGVQGHVLPTEKRGYSLGIGSAWQPPTLGRPFLVRQGGAFSVATATTTRPVSLIISQELTLVTEVSQGMAPPPRGVLYGPIKDWEKGSSKVLLELGEEGGGQWTQFVLENVSNWHNIPEFGERGRRALLQAGSNIENRRREWIGDEDWDIHISRQERLGREEEEVLRVKDGLSAERAMEILTKGLAIQDTSVNGHLEGFDVAYIRPMRADGSVLDGMSRRWILAIPKAKKRETQGPAKEVLARAVARLVEKEQEEEARHADKGLSEREVEEIAKGIVEGLEEEASSKEEDLEMEEERGGKNVRSPWTSREHRSIIFDMIENGLVLKEVGDLLPKERSWKSRRNANLARSLIVAYGECVEGGWCVDGDQSGKRGWKALLDMVVDKGDPDEIKRTVEEERLWRSASQVKAGQLAAVEQEMAEMRKQLALLAVALGAGTLEQEAEAKRTINARKGRAEEERRKLAEVKKVERKDREVETHRREEERNREEAAKLVEQVQKVKESQVKAWEACRAHIEELKGKNRAGLRADELINLGQEMKKAEELEKKIEAEAVVPTENLVGKFRLVVNGEVLKVVRVVMGHMQPIDVKGKADLEGAVGKVNNLLRVKGVTEGYTPWQVSAGAGHGELEDESTWTVKRVKEDANPLRVAGEVGKALIGVFGRTEEIINVWVEDPKSV